MTTRQEHLAWCKERALEYCNHGDVMNALMSMFSDLGKHPETAGHIGIQLGLAQMLTGGFCDAQAARKFIDGFN